MRKAVRLLLVTIAVTLLACFGTTPAFAAEEVIMDYHDLFGQYNELDGMAADRYQIEVNEIFDADPDRFIAELSKEDADTIIHHAFYLAHEQSYKNGNTSVHEDHLNARLESMTAGSPLADTVTLLLNGNIMYEASSSCIDPDQYKQNNYQKVQNAYQKDPELFLLSLSYFSNSSTIPHEIVGAIVYELSYDELTNLNAQLTADAQAVWADNDVQSVIELLQEKILQVMIVFGYEETDFSTLFSLADEVNGYLADAYYIEVSNTFDAAPEDFIAALSKLSFDKINTLAYYIAAAHSQDLDSYSTILDKMYQSAVPSSTEQDTLFLMRLSLLRIDSAPDTLVQAYYEHVQACYRENPYLFLMSLTSSDIRVYNDFANALAFGLNPEELETLDAQLSCNASADWATDEIQTLIRTLRSQIDAMLNPPPPVTEPEPTETLPHETDPTEVSHSIADPPKNDYTVALICVSIIIMLCATAFFLIQKHKRS